MEIDHEWGRPLLRAQRGAGRPHECVVARPTTAPDTKNVVNSYNNQFAEIYLGSHLTKIF